MSLNVSVIIPTYNRADTIDKAIESVLAQSLMGTEVIVVDDGSEDNTAEIVSNYDGVRYVFQEHRGISAARNKGLELARSEWIAWLDSDDLWHKDKLRLQTEYIEAHPECRILFTAYSTFSDIPLERLDESQKSMLSGPVNHQCMVTALIRRSLFERYGCFSETFSYAEDSEWMTRLLIGGENLDARLDEPLYERRVHGGNITLSTEPQRDRIIEKMWASALIKKRKGN